MSDVREFVKRRDAALRSLDIAALRALVPPNSFADERCIAGAHKARLHITTFTAAEKEVSRAWLKAHGYKEEIGT